MVDPSKSLSQSRIELVSRWRGKRKKLYVQLISVCISLMILTKDEFSYDMQKFKYSPPKNFSYRSKTETKQE